MKSLLKLSTGLALSVTAMSCQPKEAEWLQPHSLQAASGARATAITEGWASTTAYQAASTTVQLNTVRLANAAVGKLSGQSALDPLKIYLTDCEGGDGALMRAAVRVYDSWFRPNVKNRCASNSVPTTTRNNMIAAFAGSRYDATRKTALVNRIIDSYNALACRASVSVPTTDDQVMSFLGIQRQCLEWASLLGRSAGGRAIGYKSTPRISSQSNWRPGMALLKDNSPTDQHARVITDIYWRKDGTIAKLKVAEANVSPVDWVNPQGTTPWNRRVTTQEISSWSTYFVVAYDK